MLISWLYFNVKWCCSLLESVERCVVVAVWFGVCVVVRALCLCCCCRCCCCCCAASIAVTVAVTVAVMVSWREACWAISASCIAVLTMLLSESCLKSLIMVSRSLLVKLSFCLLLFGIFKDPTWMLC